MIGRVEKHDPFAGIIQIKFSPYNFRTSCYPASLVSLPTKWKKLDANGVG